MRITAMYIGGDLSVNRYKIKDRTGHATKKTKKHVEAWMEDLAETVRSHKDLHSVVGRPVTVKLSGKFRDERFPDLHNLHKVIGDALGPAL